MLWHDFYLGLGTAAASLTGLLFVALSLHPAMIVSNVVVRERGFVLLVTLLWIT